jgi:hypothetical protein
MKGLSVKRDAAAALLLALCGAAYSEEVVYEAVPPTADAAPVAAVVAELPTQQQTGAVAHGCHLTS